jgi:uncharacterized protein (DUF4415 family)
MSDKPPKKFEAGHGCTKADRDAVSDNPEGTEQELRNARRFSEAFPEMAESIRRARGRPASDSPKKQITLRLDSDVVEEFRATGPGWQGRMNAALRKAAGL